MCTRCIYNTILCRARIASPRGWWPPDGANQAGDNVTVTWHMCPTERKERSQKTGPSNQIGLGCSTQTRKVLVPWGRVAERSVVAAPKKLRGLARLGDVYRLPYLRWHVEHIFELKGSAGRRNICQVSHQPGVVLVRDRADIWSWKGVGDDQIRPQIAARRKMQVAGWRQLWALYNNAARGCGGPET
jgi:hypothetical protein